MRHTKSSIKRKLAIGKKNECWNWTAKRRLAGYGYVGFQGAYFLVHRLMYEWAFGPIPAGKEIHHKCGNRLCANPAHLEAVTRKEHIHKGGSPSARNARKTHCVYGHPYDERNTVIRSNRGGRDCRLCIKERHRVLYAKAQALQGKVVGGSRRQDHCGKGHPVTFPVAKARGIQTLNEGD